MSSSKTGAGLVLSCAPETSGGRRHENWLGLAPRPTFLGEGGETVRIGQAARLSSLDEDLVEPPSATVNDVNAVPCGCKFVHDDEGSKLRAHVLSEEP